MIRVREAQPSDNEELIRLTRSTPMSGTIALRIDRDPDFYRLASLRGDGRTFVAVRDERLVGCISLSYRKAFERGAQVRLGYIADLKVSEGARRSEVAYRLLKTVYDVALESESATYFCIVAEGNPAAHSLLTGRAGIPEFADLGLFRVRSLLPKLAPFGIGLQSRKRETGDPIRIRAIAADSGDELEGICRFVNATNGGFLFAPFVTPADFRARGPVAASRHAVLAAFEGERLAATLTLEDMGDAKADVPISLPMAMNLGVTLLRGLGRFVSGLNLPQIGEPIRSLYLRHVAVTPGHERALAALIGEARSRAALAGYSLLTLGLHHRDPRLAVLMSFPGFDFYSRGYAVRVPASESAYDHDTQIPVEDYALV